MTVPSATLQDIRTKVRLMTGRPDQSQISDTDLDFQINTFLTYDMPEHLRLFKLDQVYEFSTQPNVDVYYPDQDLNINFSIPPYIGGYESFYTQSRDQFQRIYPKLGFITTVATGNGTGGPFTYTLPSRPVLRANRTSAIYTPPNTVVESDILVTAVDSLGQTHNLIDDGIGNLIPDPNGPSSGIPDTGTINYTTGDVSVTFLNPIPSPNLIQISTVPYVASRPIAIQYYGGYFTLRPVPDQGYTVSLQVSKTPLQLLAQGDVPQLRQWWQYIALGATLKILENDGDFDEYAKYYPLFQEQQRLVNRRTLVQQTQDRTATIYTNQTQFPQGNFYNRF